MPARHKHWPEDHPRYAAAPWCRYPTKKACDEYMTQFEHGHAGDPCVKEFQPSRSKRGATNKIATCTIIVRPEKGMSFQSLMEWGLK